MTQPSYTAWSVTSYVRDQHDWTRDGQRFSTGAQEVVTVIHDPRGWRWEVVLSDDRAMIEELSIAGEVTQKTLRSIPLRYILWAAQGHLGERDRLGRSDRGNVVTPSADLSAAASVNTGGLRRSGDRPSMEDFAERWKATPERIVVGGRKITRRRSLADEFNVSPYAIDKWTRAARDAGLIPEPDPKPTTRKKDNR